MQKPILAILILFIFSCDNPTIQKVSEEKIVRDTQMFGDSLKIITIKIGDTQFKNIYKFNSRSDSELPYVSHEKIIRSTIKLKRISCSEKVQIQLDSMLFLFCQNEAFKFFDIAHIPRISEYRNLDNLYRNDFSEFERNRYMLLSMVDSLDCSIVDLRNSEAIQFIKIESIENDYSGEKLYHFINNEGDTLVSLKLWLWMF